MELAKVTSKGQITIPLAIRKQLGVREGDKVLFVEENGKIVLMNASLQALLAAQKAFSGVAEEIGAANEEERKPKPDMVYDAMAHFGASKDETVYVGDSNVDIETARNADIDCISVTWGYRDKATLEKAGATAFAEDAKQLPALLKAL